MPKNLCILGSTGSIGVQSLEIVDQFPEELQVYSLVAKSNINLLSKQILKYKPKIVILERKDLLPQLLSLLGNLDIKVYTGCENINIAFSCDEVDVVISAISGIAGLLPTLEAIKAKKEIALANKETLVAAGEIVMKEARKNNINILPVDSEHSAIFQCMDNKKELVEKLLITASGGRFRGWQQEDMKKITPEMALEHPTWNMGSKITIDSSTLVNKGLEVIEAHWLFDIDYQDIEVIVHPQSVIHSLVRFKDGSTISQMGLPDMRLPIQYALTYPNRWKNSFPRLDLIDLTKITFEKPDIKSFPSLKYAYQAGKEGGTKPCIFNSANEQAVELFLNKKISFLQIFDLIDYCLNNIKTQKNPCLQEIIHIDKRVRKIVIEKSKDFIGEVI